MKYDVTFSCGHTQTVQLFGKSADRARKIDFFEKRGVCSNCFKEQKEIEDSILLYSFFYGEAESTTCEDDANNKWI